MKHSDIQIDHFYRAHLGRALTTIYIFNTRDYHYNFNNEAMYCEEWLYWDLGKKEFGSFTFLNSKVIEELVPIANKIMLRNFRDAITESMGAIKEDYTKRIEQLEESINIFSQNTSLPTAFA